MTPDITICSSVRELNRRVADWIEQIGRRSIDQRGVFHLVLSGGRTPVGYLHELRNPERRGRLDWGRVEFYWTDERCVGTEHPDSNFGMATEVLLGFLGLSQRRIHNIRGDIDPQIAAVEYSKVLLDAFGKDADWPKFDLVLLGMGVDGHTASLYPDTEALDETDRWAMPNFVPQLEAWRITLTVPAINHSHNVAVVVTGTRKSETLGKVFNGDCSLPISKIKPTSKQLKWYLDEPAACLL